MASLRYPYEFGRCIASAKKLSYSRLLRQSAPMRAELVGARKAIQMA
jgi:hypothetical protein